MNAVTLLKRDHRNVERLFKRYRSTTKGKRETLDEITRELTMHMDAEERELYPVLRGSIPDGPADIDDAVKEHKEARALLADLANADVTAFDTDAKVATLQRAIDHHVSDEEDEVFPKAQESLGTKRLDALGARIERAKRSAPQRPPAGAARNAPGPSVGGMLSAATDRVKQLFTGEERKAPRPAARKTRSRKASAARSKASASKAGKKSRAGRARSTSGRGVKSAAKTRKKASARRGRR